MKKFALLLSFSISLATAFAQITIDQNDMAGAGDVLWFAELEPDSSHTTDYSPTGANYTWNFSAMAADTHGVVTYKNAIETPYAFFFLGPDKYGAKVFDSIGLGGLSLSDWYYFYRNNANELAIEGLGITYNGTPLPAFYEDDDELFQFPLDYGDVDQSTYRFKVDLGGLAYYSVTGNRTNEVEGWGQLTTPFGTYDCLKIKTTVQTLDTVALLGFPFPSINERRIYQWWAKGEKMAVLEVQGDVDTLGNYTPTRVRWREDAPTSAPVPVLNASSLEVFPNPVTDSRLNLSFELTRRAVVRIDLLDLQGRAVRQLDVLNVQPGRRTASYAIGALPKGVYLLQLVADGHRITKKLNIR